MMPFAAAPLDLQHGSIDQSHGAESQVMAQLIEQLLSRSLHNDFLAQSDDGARLPLRYEVVERSKADGIFSATTGVGVLREDVNVSGAYTQPCDVVLQKAYISVRPSEIIADERCFMQIHTHMGRRHMVDWLAAAALPRIC